MTDIKQKGCSSPVAHNVSLRNGEDAQYVLSWKRYLEFNEIKSRMIEKSSQRSVTLQREPTLRKLWRIIILMWRTHIENNK